MCSRWRMLKLVPVQTVIHIYVDNDVYSWGLLNTFRGFNTAFLACAVINGCRCGNVRKVSDLTRKEESRSFRAMMFEFCLHLAKGEDREHLHAVQWSMAQFRGQLQLCQSLWRGAESQGLAEPRAQWLCRAVFAQRARRAEDGGCFAASTVASCCLLSATSGISGALCEAHFFFFVFSNLKTI